MIIVIQYAHKLDDEEKLEDIESYELQEGFLVLQKNGVTEYRDVSTIKRFAVKED